MLLHNGRTSKPKFHNCREIEFQILSKLAKLVNMKQFTKQRSIRLLFSASKKNSLQLIRWVRSTYYL